MILSRDLTILSYQSLDPTLKYQFKESDEYIIYCTWLSEGDIMDLGTKQSEQI